MFLMALRLEFQPCGQIIHRDHVPSLNSAISNLISEETRLHSLSSLASIPTSESETVDAVALGLLLQEALATPPPQDCIIPSAGGLVILTVFVATPHLAITAIRQVTLSTSVSIFIQSY